MHVEPPLVGIARSAYANAFEFSSRDFATGGISPAWIFPQSDLGCRADSCWALPQISSCWCFLKK